MIPELHVAGDEKADKVVVFVHGFAVKWHSKRLFSDIAEHISDKVVSIMFDLYDYDTAGNATLLPLTDQQDRLRAVIRHAQVEYPAKQLVLVGHSMGCGLIMSLVPQLEKQIAQIILLAPAVGVPGPRIYKHIMTEQQGIEDNDGRVSFKRKDGTVSSFDRRFVREFNIDYDHIYSHQFERVKSKLHIILAATDKRTQVQVSFFDNYGSTTIEGSDHNFTGDHRQVVAELLAQIVS